MSALKLQGQGWVILRETWNAGHTYYRIIYRKSLSTPALNNVHFSFKFYRIDPIKSIMLVKILLLSNWHTHFLLSNFGQNLPQGTSTNSVEITRLADCTDQYQDHGQHYNLSSSKYGFMAPLPWLSSQCFVWYRPSKAHIML